MEFVIACVALGYALYVGSKVRNLQDRLKQLEQRGFTPIDAVVAPIASPRVPDIVPATPRIEQGTMPHTIPHVPSSDTEERFMRWIKEDFLVKLGAFLILIGFGWFVSYAFLHDWIGPYGRITLGLLIGAGVLALGVWRIQRFTHQGGIFVVLGSTIILLTICAARMIYGFFTPLSALMMMFGAVVFVAFVSVRYNSPKLAMAGLLLGSIAPLLVNAPHWSAFEILSYLLVVVLGTLWVVYYTGWKTLTPVALAVVAVYGASYMGSNWFSTGNDVALLFAFVFTALFFATNVMSILYERQGVASSATMFTAFGTSAYLIAWIASSVAAEWQSLLYVAWMLVFSLGAFAVYRGTANRVPFYIYGATSLALLGAATAAELDGAMLTIAYTIEVGAIVALSRMFVPIALSRNLGWLFTIPALMSLPSFVSPLWQTGVLHNDFFVLLILMCALWVTGAYVFENAPADDEETRGVGIAFGVVGTFYALSLVWLILHALLDTDVAVMLSLVIYTILGLLLHVAGTNTDQKNLRLGGWVLLGFVVARLLFVDVWQMELAGRIITFFVIGALLISTAFMGKKRTQETIVTKQ